MLDPLSLFVTYGLKALGLCASGYCIYKGLPKPLNFPRLMRITFHRNKLYVMKGKNEIFPELECFERKEWGFIFRYRVPPGMALKQFMEKKEHIDAAFNGESVVYGQGNALIIEVMRLPLPGMTYFSADQTAERSQGMAIPICLGMTRKGLEVIDLARAPHGVIGGESGSGKSVFVRQVLTGLGILRRPDQLQMTLVDLKHGVELSMFERLPHVVGFAKDTNEVGKVLAQVNALMDERGYKLRSAGALNIAEYNAKRIEYMPYHIVVVDELAELEDTTAIERISRLGRAYGVHLLLATQRPDAKVLEGQIKANCPLAIAFKTKNTVNSMILLDNPNAAHLPPVKGRAIVQFQGERQVQTPLLDEDRARSIIRKLVPTVKKEGSDHDRKGNEHTERYF